MYELPKGRTMQLSLDSQEARDVLALLRFRLRCRNEGKVGMVAMGFGEAYWVDKDGEYMDGKVPKAETELAAVQALLAERA